MRVIEIKKAVIQQGSIVVELSMVEATVLRNLLGGHVCGGVETVRAVTNDLYDQLCRAGCPKFPKMFSDGVISGKMPVDTLIEELDAYLLSKVAT